MTDKLTLTFVVKLAILFALLLTGFNLRPNKLALPADSKTAQESNPAAVKGKDLQHKHNLHYKLARNVDTDDSSI